MPELILKRVGRGRQKGSKMPKVHKAKHTPIHISYLEEKTEREQFYNELETEEQMRKRLFE